MIEFHTLVMMKEVKKKRALICIRLSRVTDATTSPKRQRQACEELCKARGYDIVGIAEDLDVSAGKTSPFDRPQLGQWLRDPTRYDVIVFMRVDRFVRRLFDLADAIRWSQDHGVALVSATESHFDLSTKLGGVVALLVASIAEMELDAISERNSSAFKHNFTLGKWRGGQAPWGYVPEKIDGEWRLVQDPVQVEVIHEVVAKVLEGQPLRAVAHELTARGIPTPRDSFAMHQGREVKGYAWHPSRLKAFLTSQTLLGRVVMREQLKDAQGRPQRDAKGRKIFGDDVLVTNDDGSPVVRAEPILTMSVFKRVSAELEGRENRKEPTKRSTGLLLRIIYCGVCGQAAYRLKGGAGRKPRYRCASAQGSSVHQCDNRTISLEWADGEVERQILETMGPLERKRRIWFSGNDHTDELTEVNDMLEDLVDQLGTGVFKRGTPQRERLDQRIAALTERQAELSASPRVEPGWVYEGTGETLADWWADASDQDKNIWLRQYGFRYEWVSHSGDNGRIVVDEFKQVGDLTMDLDADTLLGPVWDIVSAMSDPVNIEAYNALPD